jgi:predicted Zn finger-like uncharacterized protein
MSELLVAQCPYCQTRFRLSQEHLQAAAGNVRCGACLKVFNAQLAIAGEPQPTGEPATPSAPAAPRPQGKPTGPLMIHDDLDLDELDLEALGLDESLLEEINPAARTDEQGYSSPPDQARFELEPDPQPQPAVRAPAQPPASEVQAPIEEQEADPWDRLEEQESPPDQGAEPLTAGEPEDDDHDLHDDFLATPRARDFESATASTRPADETLSRSDPDPAVQDKGIYLRDRPAQLTRPAMLTPAESDQAPEGSDIERQEPEIGSLIDLPELQEEPLLLYEQPASRRSRYRPLWLALSVLALLGLPAQALYYNFTNLAHDEQSRPYLEQFCLLAGCELPARVDISLVRSSNLMVRPHPEYPKALAIDVILYNRAEFAQPFPVLRMTFNDTRGREVLSKRFRPDEYLGGELAGATLMPPQTPVHIALEMLDPGPDAAGYQLDFLSP